MECGTVCEVLLFTAKSFSDAVAVYPRPVTSHLREHTMLTEENLLSGHFQTNVLRWMVGGYSVCNTVMWRGILLAYSMPYAE